MKTFFLFTTLVLGTVCIVLVQSNAQLRDESSTHHDASSSNSSEATAARQPEGFKGKIAKTYQAGLITFDLGDDLMNQFWAWMIDDEFLESTGNRIPNPAFDVYLAFDEGEFHRSGDSESVDPVRKYTDPAIDEFAQGTRDPQ